MQDSRVLFAFDLFHIYSPQLTLYPIKIYKISIMSIQMSLVFCALVTQMAILFVFLLPMPHSIRTNLVNGAAAINLNANFKVGLIFSSILMFLQFMDCLKKLQKFSHIENPYFAQVNTARGGDMLYDQLALKFYAQRNLYITGAVLYLGLSINSVVSILRNLVHKQIELRKLQLQPKADDSEVLTKLRKELAQRDLNIETMKKQIKGAQAAYDSLTPLAERSKDD